MRVLFSTAPTPGHFHPLVPVARAMQRAGHDVAFVSGSSWEGQIRAAGFRAFSTPLDFGSPDPQVRAFEERFRQMPDDRHREAFFVVEMFGGVGPAVTAQAILDLAASWPFDLLVHESAEFGGPIAAERLGVPYAAVSISLHPWVGPLRDPLIDALNRTRADWGLPSDPTLDTLGRHLFLTYTPPSLALPDAPPLPPTLQRIRFEGFDAAGEAPLPAWAGQDLPRPVVYATLGTVANEAAGIFESIVAGLRDEVGTLILTVGRNRDPAAFGPQPDHVRIERYIPQSALLPLCDLMVAHGGYNTVMGALAAGVPLVLTPIAADQPFNAARCVELGLGLSIDRADVSPDTVAAAARAILADPTYAGRAVAVADEIAALPPVETAVGLLERLASPPAPGA